jgi:membrane protein YdbS with pleckstrin-like domain
MDVELPVTPPADSAAAPPPPQAMPTPTPAAAEVRMLDPRVVTLNRIVGSIVWGVFSLIHLLSIIVTFMTGAWLWWAQMLFALSWIPMTGFFVWLALKWPEIDYRHWRYRVDADEIEIWSGVLWRQAVVVPRSRVQHIDVSQGPIERSYGLATLSIHTAGTQYSKVDLPGLDHGIALTIRDALLPKDAEPAV